MPDFLVQYTYSPVSAEARDQARPRHRSWVADQLTAGAVISSGPFADGTGAGSPRTPSPWKG